MEKARAELDGTKRKELYGQFQQIFADEVPALLLYYPVYSYGVSNAMHNVQIGALNHPSQRFEGFADWYMETKRVPANQAGGAALPTPPQTAPAATLGCTG